MSAYKEIPLLAAIWLVIILIVNPLGEFPLNDDWSYTKSVLALCERGVLIMDAWPAMTLVAQIGWGALFCKIFGFSFLILRISTLITAFWGIIAFYRLAFSISNNKKIALFASLALFLNPIFFSLSFTFMTDIHFFSFSIFAVFFYFKYMEKGKIHDIVLAIIFSIIAVLIRQPGIVFPLAYLLCTFYKNRNVMVFIKSSIPFLCTSMALLLHSFWLQSTQYSGAVVGVTGALSSLYYLIDLYHVLLRLANCILYSGLFVLPLVVFYWKNIKALIAKYKFKLLLVLIPIVALLLVGGVHYPKGNILYNLGVGPKVFKDIDWDLNVSPQMPNDLWMIFMKLISIIGSVMMLFLLIKKEQNSTACSIQQKQKIYLWISMLFYTILLIINKVFFDRHVILLAALAALLMLFKQVEYTAIQRNIAIGYLLLMTWFSIVSTHDYFSWNRARWEATDYLTQELKISIYKIDGGFEFNGWHNAGQLTFRGKKMTDKSWWWVTDDEYVVSFGNIEGYKKIKTYPYSQLLTFQKDSIFVLKRE